MKTVRGLAAGAWRDRIEKIRLHSIALINAIDEHEVSDRAAAMAFSVFLGLVPLAALLGWLLARFAGGQITQGIVESVYRVAPTMAKQLVDEQVRRLVEQGATIAPIGAFGFIWIAASGAHAAMSAIQLAGGGRARAWWKNRVLAIVIVTLFLVLAVGSTTVLVLLEAAVRKALAAGHLEEGMAKLARTFSVVMSVLAASSAAAFFFWLSTYGMTNGRRKVIWPGALIAAAVWLFVSWIFSLYTVTIGRYSVFYGSLAAVALLMMWLWISCFILLAGAEINIEVEGRRPKRRLSECPSPSLPPSPSGES